MSPHPVVENGCVWRTAEALFQANRFPSDSEVREHIREQKSPMAAKMIAKKNRTLMIMEPGSEQDLANMRQVLRLKIDQHPLLKKELIATGDTMIIEDCSSRKPSIWGAQLINGEWVGDNLLGQLWMELRTEVANANSRPLST